jgi:hypothetical protein
VDDDWRGLDWEWFRRIARGSAGRARFPFEEFRPYFEATRDRRPRPVHWVVESPPPGSVEERRGRGSRWLGASSRWAFAGVRAPSWA